MCRLRQSHHWSAALGWPPPPLRVVTVGCARVFAALQAGRWRGLVQRTVVVAVVLALLQSLLYRTYYHGEQQQQAGGVALSIPATNLGSSGKAAHAEGAAQAAADLDDKPPSASAADAEETGAVAAAAATVQDAEASAAQEAATAAAAAQLAEGTAGVAQQPAPGATQDQAAADAAAAALGTRAGGRMACEGSRMCSVGKVKRYWGEVTTNKQLRTMLEGLAYKKDVSVLPARTCAVQSKRPAAPLGRPACLASRRACIRLPIALPSVGGKH